MTVVLLTWRRRRIWEGSVIGRWSKKLVIRKWISSDCNQDQLDWQYCVNNLPRVANYHTSLAHDTTLWNEDTSLIGTHLQVPTPLKPVHTTLWNEDTSLIGTHLQVPTPLKPVHTTLWNEDTSSGPNSIEACTYHPLKWGHITSSGPNSIEACTYHPLKWGHIFRSQLHWSLYIPPSEMRTLL